MKHIGDINVGVDGTEMPLHISVSYNPEAQVFEFETTTGEKGFAGLNVVLKFIRTVRDEMGELYGTGAS